MLNTIRNVCRSCDFMEYKHIDIYVFSDYISFSAHTDYEQTSEFIRTLNPPHIVSMSLSCISISSTHYTYSKYVSVLYQYLLYI